MFFFFVLICSKETSKRPILVAIKNTSNFEEEAIIDVGFVRAGSTHNFTFSLKNTQSSPFNIRAQQIIGGIEIGAYWMRKYSTPLGSYQIEPNSVKPLLLFITFKKFEYEEKQSSSLVLSNDDSILNFTFIYTPKLGHINLSINFPSTLFIGNAYSGNIIANYSLQGSLRVLNILSSIASIEIESYSQFIREKGTVLIGQVNASVNYLFIQNMIISSLFSHSKSLSRKRWINQFNDSQKVKVDLMIETPHCIMRKFIPFNLAVYPHPSLEHDISPLYPNMPYSSFIFFTNSLPFDLEYSFNFANLPFHFNIKDTLIVSSGGSANFSIEFTPLSTGIIDYKIPIFTNATAPFYLKISGEVLHPRLVLLDSHHTKVNLINFQDTSNPLFVSSPIQKAFQLKNEGKAPIKIKQILISGIDSNLHPFLSIYIKNNIIYPKNSIEILFKVKLVKMNTRSFNTTVTINVFDFLFNYQWNFSLSNEAKIGLERIRFWPKIILFLITSLLPIITMTIKIVQIVDNYRHYFYSNQHIRAEIQQLTVVEKVDIITQCHFDNFEGSGGEFLPMSEDMPHINPEHLIIMNEILSKITKK